MEANTRSVRPCLRIMGEVLLVHSNRLFCAKIRTLSLCLKYMPRFLRCRVAALEAIVRRIGSCMQTIDCNLLYGERSPLTSRVMH